MEKLLWLLRCSEVSAIRAQFNQQLEEAILKDELKWQAKWTQAIAVGERAFIEEIEQRVGGRQKMQKEEPGGGWVLQEEQGAFSMPENSPIGSNGISIEL